MQEVGRRRTLSAPLLALGGVDDGVKLHLAAAGLPESIRFYDLPHTSTSLLIADGVAATEVSTILGHTLASTTLNVYAHVLPGAERVTADAMDWVLW